MADMPTFVTEEEDKLQERILREREMISGIKVETKKKSLKEYKKMGRDISLRIQASREKIERSMRDLNKQTHAANGNGAEIDKERKVKCIKEIGTVVSI